MTKSQKILKEIEELRTNYFQKVKQLRKELEGEITSERQEELHKEGKEDCEKFEKEIKERVLSDLPNWFLDPQGFVCRVGGRLKKIDLWENRQEWGNFYFRNKNYRKEIINEFINEIKQSPQDWEIEVDEDCVVDGYSYYKCWVVKHKSGRKHYKPFSFEEDKEHGHNIFTSFTPEEWVEIKIAINNQEQIPLQKTPINQGDNGQNFQLEQSSKNDKWKKYGGSIIFGSLSFLFLLLSLA